MRKTSKHDCTAVIIPYVILQKKVDTSIYRKNNTTNLHTILSMYIIQMKQKKTVIKRPLQTIHHSTQLNGSRPLILYNRN